MKERGEERKRERELLSFEGRVQLQSVWCGDVGATETKRNTKRAEGAGCGYWFATYSAAGCCSMAEYCAPGALPSRRSSSQRRRRMWSPPTWSADAAAA